MNRYRALALIAMAELLGMSLWFSASAVAPALKVEWGLTDAATSWLTLAVQLGFVAGTLVSAVLNLPDVMSSRRLFAVAAFLGAGANAALATVAQGTASGIVLRFLTGFFLAGVYPPGMKIMASWFRQGRGMALGVLVGMARCVIRAGESCSSYQSWPRRAYGVRNVRTRKTAIWPRLTALSGQ